MRKFYLFSFESYHDENGHQEKVEMKPESQIWEGEEGRRHHNKKEYVVLTRRARSGRSKKEGICRG